MLKVKVKKMGQVVVGATSMLALGPLTMGCALDASGQETEQQETLGQQSQAVEPGSATLFTSVQAYNQQEISVVVTNATTDDFIRVGEKLKMSCRAVDYWWLAHPNGYEGYDDVKRLKKLNIQVTAHFYGNGVKKSSKTVAVNSWSNTPHAWELVGTTQEFTVPANTDVIRFSYAVTDGGDASVNVQVGEDNTDRVVVFGARPEKHLVFENDFSTLRHKIIEDGALVRGRDVLVGYTDYRANTLADTTSINTVIGQQKNYGRFGPDIIPLHGTLEHEVTIGVQIDGVWGQEAPMVQRFDSAMVPRTQMYNRRFAFERRISLPANAKQVAVYFHIKTYLRADYSQFPFVVEKYFADGERILVREVWDNNGGSGNDYHFGTEASTLPSVQPLPADIRRTVVFVQGETSPGQDMFVRGGVDHGVAEALLGKSCTNSQGDPTYGCSIPITNLNRKNAYTDPWKVGDGLLDWYGVEAGQQGSVNGQQANGTAADWTTNYWPPEWGPEKTVAHDGYGLEVLNRVCGMHCWMVDVDMDCAKAYHSPDATPWFEIKTFISNGPGWEPDVEQGLMNAYGTPEAPYVSKNHLARCGMVNVFRRGQSTAEFYRFDQFLP